MSSKPSLLAYTRSINPTDAAFFSVDESGKKTPIPISVKAVLGTQSQFDADTGESKPGGNPQRVEYASLPQGSRQLFIEFSVVIVGEATAPQSCNVPLWRENLKRLVGAYIAQDGFSTLGNLYAANIANGRWAWRNRAFADSFKVSVDAGGETMVFDALNDHKLADLAASAGREDVQKLGSIIAAGLRGERIVRLRVTGTLDIGDGMAVYPSQEFAGKDDDKEAIKKILFGIPAHGLQRCAAFHEQKIGNAIRTIDIWHGGAIDAEDQVQAVDAAEPLAVNPYAQSRDAYIVVRNKKQASPDFYSLLSKKIDSLIESAEQGDISGDHHFVIANLVRGGVFGFEKKEKGKKAKGAE